MYARLKDTGAGGNGLSVTELYRVGKGNMSCVVRSINTLVGQWPIGNIQNLPIGGPMIRYDCY